MKKEREDKVKKMLEAAEEASAEELLFSAQWQGKVLFVDTSGQQFCFNYNCRAMTVPLYDFSYNLPKTMSKTHLLPIVVSCPSK